MTKFNFNKFNNPLKISLNGNASLINDALRLTNGDYWDRDIGSAFYSKQISMKDKTSFKTKFQFQIYNLNNSSSDSDNQGQGFVFMLQNESRGNQAVGDPYEYGTLGYKGISSSVAIEFDTADSGSFEPSDNHIGLNVGGSVESIVTNTPDFDLNSGNVINAWIDYNGKNSKLDVFVSETSKKPKKPTLSTFFDIIRGDSRVYVGFGGATERYETDIHDILTWEFSTSDGNTNKPSTPNKTINGNNRNNRLQGTNKAERINGKGGNDVLTGRGGNDTLTGGGGRDTLTGGAGNDILTGGGGADDFVLGSGKVYKKQDVGIDIIKDFRPNVDDIVLNTETFVTLRSEIGEGFSIEREFASVRNRGAVASSVADIVYVRSTGDLYYNANSALPGFGGGGKIATLDGAPRISASDFVLE